MSTLLIDEPPLQVLPSLARAIGLSRAVIVQQLHWRLNNHRTTVIDGERFICDTYDDWVNQFPFWSPRAIRKYFTDLENDGLIISVQPNNYDRTKHYRLNYDKLKTYELLNKAFPHPTKSADGSDQTCHIEASQTDACYKEERVFKREERHALSSNSSNAALTPLINGSDGFGKRSAAAITDTEAERIWRETFPEYQLSITQSDAFHTLTDLDADHWRAVCDEWKSNDYNPRRIGSLVDRYNRSLKYKTKPERPAQKLPSAADAIAAGEARMAEWAKNAPKPPTIGGQL